MPAHEAGFESVDDEHRDVRLPVEGDLPAWLDGTLVRNGPGKFETGTESVAHWFDGLAMLRSFRFRDATVRYTNRFLGTDAYRTAVEAGTLPSGGFATGAGLLDRLKAAVVPEPTDNANVNVARFGGRFVALTEAPRAVEFDPRTLETLGGFEFDDGLSPHLVSAHPRRDPRRGETVNVAVEFGRTSRYRVHRIADGSTSREPVASVGTDRPAYVHSFALTADHVVLAEFPLVVHPLRLLLPTGGSFVDAFEWRPERGTRFTVIDRDGGGVVSRSRAAPCFCFHHVNAFERDGHAVVDLVAFDGPEAIDGLYLDSLRGGVPDLGGELRRYRVPLEPGAGGAGDRIEPRTLHRGMTLPRFDGRREAREYRFAYGQGTATERDHRLVAVDLRAGGTAEFAESGSYFGEPVVVAPPDAAEGEGVVLSVGLDAEAGESFLAVLEAGSLEERARATLPGVVPFDFHGQFFRGV